jgi:hypothetical protein
MVETIERPSANPVGYVQWTPIIAGALTAAALATVLHTFAGAVGLAISSTAPTWRDASIGLFILSGVYLVLVALASYGLGGYIAGLLRDRMLEETRGDAAELRDNIHGLLVWGVATLVTAFLILATVSAGARLAAPAGSVMGPAASVAGENTVAFDVDRVLRGDRRPGDATDIAATRAEVSRILFTASSHTGVATEDRNYLARLVSARAGIAGPDAERRADAAIASAKENLTRARRSAVILAFMAGAAALLGAVAAWIAAAAGGQHRDQNVASRRWNILGRRPT